MNVLQYYYIVTFIIIMISIKELINFYVEEYLKKHLTRIEHTLTT